jgi:hypothetical protein
MSALKTLSMLIVLAVSLSGCERDRMSEVGFSLPQGNVMKGREAFVYMQCHQCHTLVGEEFPAIPDTDPPYVELGGTVTQVKTYGQLVTAIINPSHKLARGYPPDMISEDGVSNMYVYNEHMTVQELIDLVMFLQPHYEVYVPKRHYRIYP